MYSRFSKNSSHAPLRRTAATLSALAVLSALTLSACGAAKDSAPPADKSSAAAAASKAPTGSGTNAPKPLPVTVATAQVKATVSQLPVDAELTSLSSPDISAEVAGVVAQVLVKPGEQVRQGQVLAVLDGADLALSAAEARAQVAQVQAQVAERARAATRASELYSKEYVSRASKDAALSELDAARAQLAAVQARARLTERSLHKTKVVAPFDGTVVDIKSAQGAYVRAGDALMHLWSAHNSVLKLKVPLDYLGEVKAGQPVTLRWAGSTLASKVLRVNPVVDLNSRSFDAHADIPAQLASFGGLRMRADIEVQGKPQLLVPAQAPQLDGVQAFVVTRQGGKAHKVPVTLGEQAHGMVAVRSGLKEGDEVVVEGAAFANEGQAVRVLLPTSPSGQPALSTNVAASSAASQGSAR